MRRRRMDARSRGAKVDLAHAKYDSACSLGRELTTFRIHHSHRCVAISSSVIKSTSSGFAASMHETHQETERLAHAQVIVLNAWTKINVAYLSVDSS